MQGLNDVQMTRRTALELGAAGAAAVGMAGCSSDDGTDAGSSAGSAATTSDGTTVIGSAEVDCTSSEIFDIATDDLQDWLLENVYDEEAQADIMTELEAAKDGQTLEAPLVEYNPFFTNTQSLYVYFTTEEEASVSYTVNVSDDEAANITDESFTYTSIDDYTASVDDGELETEHEFQVKGLIPGVANTVTITATYEDGTAEACTLTCTMGGLVGSEELQLEVTEGESEEELEPGLYVVLGNDSDDADFMFYYDNQGILRSEVPVIGYRSHRMLFDEQGTMYYSASQSRMAAMSKLGQITDVYYLGDFDLHHDYVWRTTRQMLILATDTSRDDSDEDLVITLDIDTGEVEQIIDMGDLLPAYKETAFAYHEENYEPEEGEEDDVAGWMHINSIQYLEDEDAVLLSSRETSSIFKVSGLSDTPTLDYILASDLFWSDTEYADLVFAQEGDFTVHGGQHCLIYVEDDELEDGQYYLQFYNNNYGKSASTTNDFDYEGAGIGVGDDPSSYYYEYLVDENERTFELVDSLAVPYSGFVSSVQWKGSNLIVDSGAQGLFTEYDADYTPIRTFSMGADKFIYRVFKYDL